MSILHNREEEILREKLIKIAGDVRFLPRLKSADSSLDNQPAKAALINSLKNKNQIVLEGVAGSGKTVLALSLLLDQQEIECAYMEASRWVPSRSDNLESFLMASYCDIDKAMEAYSQGKLVLIVDAIDEAPWTTGGSAVPEVIQKIAEEIEEEAGLLISSRTSREVPELSGECIYAALAGVHPNDMERFIAFYSGSRTGVSKLIERLRRMELSDELKYSPLVLRLLAEGLSLDIIPSNLVELYEMLADFHIRRECDKPKSTGVKLEPGTWQFSYSQPDSHRLLISVLVFGSEKSGETLSEPEFEKLIRTILKPTYFEARALVDISTLMSQHPIIPVRYIGRKGITGAYHLECLHDWARIALFPKFLSQDYLDASIMVSDKWHKALPHPGDYALAWSWLESIGRVEENIDILLLLTESEEQSEEVAKWLSYQLFSQKVPKNVVNKIFQAIATLAGKFLPEKANLTTRLGLDIAEFPHVMLIHEGELSLNQTSQIANFEGLVLNRSRLTIGPNGPFSIWLRHCFFNDVNIVIENECEVHLIGCFLPSLKVETSKGKLFLNGCIYDESHCDFPNSTIGLDTCISISISEAIEWIRALAEVFRRIIRVKEKPELAQFKNNISERYIYGGSVSLIRDKAERIMRIMERTGYIIKSPTGRAGRTWHFSATSKFNAEEAARFIEKPTPEGLGSMTKEIIEELNS